MQTAALPTWSSSVLAGPTQFGKLKEPTWESRQMLLKIWLGASKTNLSTFGNKKELQVGRHTYDHEAGMKMQ